MEEQLELQLTTAERETLSMLEETITRGIASFIEVGQALMEIRESRLYREEHKTFEVYCRNRWGFDKRYANRLIQGSSVAIEMGPIGPKTESQARELTAVPEEHREKVMREATESGRVTARSIREIGQALSGKGARQALHSSESVEWYTPEYIIEAAREAMGGIDLDPASCPEANETVKAAVHYSEGGLEKKWFGRVWMNPPYGRGEGWESNQSVWTRHAITMAEAEATEQTCMLVNAAIGTKWFSELYGFWMCLFDERIQFDGHGKKDPTNGNAVVYIGNNVKQFHDAFERYGRIVPPSILVRSWVRSES